MILEIIDKVYVYLIDGTTTFVPINGRQIHDALFEILDDPEYSDIDGNVLFQFYRGDIVEIVDAEHPDNKYQYFAKSVVLHPKESTEIIWNLNIVRLREDYRLTNQRY